MATAYESILAMAESCGRPRAFMTDITVHDKAVLVQWSDSCPFGWLLGMAGTHMVRPGRVDHGRPIYEIYADHAAQEGDYLWFIWTGRELLECSPVGWISRMREYHDAALKGDK